jgi:hypothetical protein
MTAYDRLAARFGRPEIQCWSPTEYRVIVHGWHQHSGAATGEPIGDGKTLEAACEVLLAAANRPEVEVVEGECDRACAARYRRSPKAEIARRGLMSVIEQAAAEVDRWPAWKRCLPPCPADGCTRAAGHKCECG